MLKMRKYNFMISLLVASLLMGGCTKVNEEAYSFITPDNFYKTEKDAEASVIGVYPLLTRIDLLNMINGLGCVGSVRDSRELAISEGGITESSEVMGRVWQSLYEGVRKANTSIDGISGSPIAENVRNRYLAEAKVLRAHFYFHLLRLWGDIPFRTTAVVEDDKLPVNPIRDSYLQLITDLRWSLPYIWQSGQKPAGRVDVFTAKALLAHIYITLASSARSYNSATTAKALKPYHTAFKDSIAAFYGYAKQLSGEVITQPGRYTLLNDWTKLWGRTEDSDNRNNTEFLWVNQTAPGLVGLTIPWIPQYTQYTPAYNGGQFLNIAYEFVKTFDPADVRFKEGFIWSYHNTSITAKVNIENWRRRLDNPAYPASTAPIVVYETADTVIRENSYWALGPKKFFDKQYKAILASGPAYAYPFYRMAEAYLWYAEAENELNGMTLDAVNRINRIRQRAGIPAYTAAQFSKDEFRDKILDERLWELFGEGRDYYDLVRMGQLEERCQGVETTADGKDTRPNPRTRLAEYYWLPYPTTEKGLNTNLKGIDRMNFN